MKLHEPVKDFIPKSYPAGDVTQWHGENIPLYSKICPTADTCLTGGHNGIDIVRPWGTPILAVDDGLVVEVRELSTGYGKHVRFVNKDEFEFTNGHLSRIDVKPGDRIKAGQQIGLMGNTGFVVSGPTSFWKLNPYAGTHLHFGVRKLIHVPNILEPASLTYLPGSPDVYRCNVENYDNGCFGFLPLTADDFAEKEYNEVQDITDTIAKVQEVGEKQTDPTIKSAFAKAVDNLLRRLISLVK
jgi:murein DD-endopeptidase MepM/ murein hydrolase activator NlpD